MNMLLVLEPLVQATLGNANFSPYSVLVVAVLMLINLELPFSHIRSAFACWHSMHGFAGLSTSCKSNSKRSSHSSHQSHVVY